MSVTRIQPTVLFEDRDLVVLNKPAGLAVHRGAGVQQRQLLSDWLLKKYPEVSQVGENPARPGLVHRLDADTSGVMVVARNAQAYQKLKSAFQKREINKSYVVLVHGPPAWISKTIDLSIHRGARGLFTARHPNQVAKLSQAKQLEFREALTELLLLEHFKNFSLIEAHPRTGRTHQIRVHLRAIGYPIAGDKLYAQATLRRQAQAQLGLTRQFLHAVKLTFKHPRTGKSMSFEASLPQDLEQALLKARAE